MQVFETEEGGSGQLGEDPVDDVHDELAAADLFSVDRCVTEREQIAAEPFEARQPQHRAGHIEDGCRGHVPILRRQITPDARKAPLLGLLDDRIEVARLADPRLAGDQEELAAPGEHVVEPTIGEL